ncbi:MAG: extracellular solute-binding protein [Litorivicinaceae bacterium]|nr:extracellular solute-binding protein [Litorivicinaceae bacterium]MDP5364327.1 extracellular solute-binding protein [Litorivicinaceae bacterium]
MRKGGQALWGICVVTLVGCSKPPEVDLASEWSSANQLVWTRDIAAARHALLTPYPALGLDQLPGDLAWETHSGEPFLGDPNSVPGGTFYDHANVYPLTLRTVGPDSNNSFRGYLLANQWSLTTLHPDTEVPMPELALEWAVSADQTTLFFRLDPTVRWSDGVPVTADDYLYTIEFMRSEAIVAPWYNNYFTEQILGVDKYDDYTIAVRGPVPKTAVDLHTSLSISPKPRHFHVLDAGWVQNTNWAIEPNTGPYQIERRSIVDGKGKYLVFEKKADWWGWSRPQYRGRFNVDRVRIKIIRDPNTAFQAFNKGDLDSFALILPEFWHEKAKGPAYDRGYLEKLWVYNDAPRPSTGVWMNQAHSLLAEQSIRLGIQHSLNFDKMLSTVLRNDYVRLHQHFTGYGAYTNPEVRPRAFDLAKADQYFGTAGFDRRGPDGIRVRGEQRLSLTMTYSQAVHTPRLVVLQDEAKKAGLEIKLQLLDGQNAFRNIMEKQHELAWMGWSTGFRPAYWEHYHSTNAGKPQTNNITNTAIAELDQLIESYRNAVDAETRIALSHVIQARLDDEAMFAPGYMVPYSRGAHWRWIRFPEAAGTRDGGGLYDPFASASGGLFWIDPVIRDETRNAQQTGDAFSPVLRVDERFRP